MNQLGSMILILFHCLIIIEFSLRSTVTACNEKERQALLTFKQHVQDPYNRLSSWDADADGNMKDCCRWNGVVCENDKTDDHQSVAVTQLHLHQFGLGGELSPSLLELKHLHHLDLSVNLFNISIPPFLGSLYKLRYLNLAYGEFVGMIPPQLGNLSSLRYLDMVSASRDLRAGDLDWLSHLSSLEYLNMSLVDLSKASHNWLHGISMLSSLLELHLKDCNLYSMPSDISYVQFTSLKILDLSFNHFNTSNYLPEWLYTLYSLEELDLTGCHFQKTISETVGNMVSLTRLDLFNNEFEGEIPNTLANLCNLNRLGLSGNKLHGEISAGGFLGNSSRCIAGSLTFLSLGGNKLLGPLPGQLGRFKNLEYLSLRENSFSGSIPSSLGRLPLLRVLELSKNKLNGSLPKSFGHLSELEILRISGNTLECLVTETHLANLTKLKTLEMDSMVLKLSPDWTPPFQLDSLSCRACELGARFPEWLRTQKTISQIDLSSGGISGIVPIWFWNMSSQLIYLNLSYNQLHGELPNLLQSTNQYSLNSPGIYLNSNRFQGRLPLISSDIGELDLSNNSFSGPISDLLCNPQKETNALEVLDLSGNLLSGELPQCWFFWNSLKLIRFESNNINGKIPNSMGSLITLQSLHLRNNSFSGEIPSSLRNCTELSSIDLGENTFTGSIPTWIGESLPNLISLRLRLNEFDGGLPKELCHLSSLRLLDLAHNNLSGPIPRCFSNLSAMASKQNSSTYPSHYLSSGRSVETALLVTKGRQVEYAANMLILATSMDLSNNSLSGKIPEELTSLFELQSLNLSENYFTGKIPIKIGSMRSLESLDFSENILSGLIPQSMKDLSFLGHLNLSYNNLSGSIPSATQLQSFTDSSYMGNQGLCGPPLKNCNEDDQPQLLVDSERETKDDEDNDWIEKNCFYISLTLGLIVGFWGFWGVLVVKKAWRFAYFGFLDNVGYKLWNYCSN